MNAARPVLLLAGLLGLTLLGAPHSPSTAESAELREHIQSLLLPRRKPERLPLDPPNPFLTVSGPAAAPTGGPAEREVAPDPAPVAADDGKPGTAEMLARLAAKLRITGLIRIKDQVNVIINDGAWKEGDYIIAEHSPRVVQLQVVRIQPGQLTLRLDDAELVLRFSRGNAAVISGRPGR